jgi:hypothetical protein
MRTTLWSTQAGDIPASLAFTNNFSATSDPGVSNDSVQGYQVGSTWFNTTTKTQFQCFDATAGAAVWGAVGNGSGLSSQGNPASQDTAATLTAAQLFAKILTTAPAGAIALTLPLATAMDTAFPGSAAGASFDFSVINTAGAANTATMTTNTGWTLVGSMAVAQNVSGRFKARKTAAGAWTLYRIA